MKRFMLCLLLMLAVISGGCGSDSPGITSDNTHNASETANGQNYKPGDILVVFRPPEISQAVTASAVKDGVYASYMASIAKVEGCTVGETFSALSQQGNGLFAVLHTEEGSEKEVVERLKARPDVIGAQLNYEYRLMGRVTPNDPKYDSLWGMEAIKAPDAWEITTGSNDVYVAIMDTGIDNTHPDIAFNFETDGYSGNFTFLNIDGDYSDENGHGTHVAGTIGAAGNNWTGVAGVNWYTKLISLRISNKDGKIYSGAVQRALSHLLELLNDNPNLKIASVNMSYGERSTKDPEEFLNDPEYLAYKALDDTNRVVMCMAAGNLGQNDETRKIGDGFYVYPALYPNLQNKIVVAAADNIEDYPCADFSYWSPEYVDIAAPGAAILSTAPQESTMNDEHPENVEIENGYKYITAQGTSMATPHVAGTAALLASACPNATAKDIKIAVLAGANDDYATNYTKWGFLDVKTALDILEEMSKTPAPVEPAFPVKIDAENFPDNIFRNYISRKFDKDKDGILSREEAEAVTKMNVSNGKIASLKGIEYFTALNELDCSMNKLTELDISNNTALTDLNCFINQIMELDVSKNTALIWLTCASNLLTELDISRNTALTGLSCSYNQIKSLDVSKNTALTTLDCGYNPQLNVDVSKNTSLEILCCEGNRLAKIDVSKNTALTELWCWDNQLKELDLSSNTALKKLLCWDNLLTEIDISSCPHLFDIECDKNVIIIRGSKPKIVISPLSNAVKGKAYSFQFDAESKLPITWSAESDSLPQGLTLSESGLLSGTPTKAGTYTFSVTASNSIGSTSAEFTLQVFTPVSISTSSLKAGTFGNSYSVTLKAKGTAPITWAASGLPAGLSINKTSGKISGKPSATGTFSVKIKAKNAASSKTKTLKLKINAVPPKLSGPLSDAELGIAYSSQLQIKKGSPVITWSASGLPEGLAIEPSTGLISGTPSGYSESGFNVTVTAENSAGSDSLTVKLNVKGTAPKITTSKLTNATQGKSYKLTVKASGSKTITWKAKNLPSGLSINKKTGKISGTPKVSGSFKVTVYAANPVKTVSKKFTLKVKAAETESSELYSHDTQDNAEFESESESEAEAEALTGENNLYASPEEKEEHEDFSIQTGILEDEIFIAAELGEISADNEGMYDFALTLSDDVHAGLKLIYLANSDNPSDDDNIAEFFDDEGNEISAVPENRKIIISVWLNKGVIYSPSVAVKK